MLIDGRQRPPLGDFYEQHYASLARESRIYIANLVRYQADHGFQKLDPKARLRSKNAQVKELWRSTRDELFRELRTIAERFGRCSVLVAPGTAFLAEVKELAAELDSLDMRLYITNHPSRTTAVYYPHYNLNNWNCKEAPGCTMMDRVTAFMKHRQLMMTAVRYS